MIKCESCGKELRDNAKFCDGCGTAYAEPEPVKITECPKCGTELRENAKFCGKCGNVIGAVGTKTPQSALTAKTSTLKKPKIQIIFFTMSFLVILVGIILNFYGVFQNKALVFRSLEIIIIGVAAVIILFNVFNDKKNTKKVFFALSCLVSLFGLGLFYFGFSQDFTMHIIGIIGLITLNIRNNSNIVWLFGLGIIITGLTGIYITYKVIREGKWARKLSLILSGALGSLILLNIIIIENILNYLRNY